MFVCALFLVPAVYGWMGCGHLTEEQLRRVGCVELLLLCWRCVCLLVARVWQCLSDGLYRVLLVGPVVDVGRALGDGGPQTQQQLPAHPAGLHAVSPACFPSATTYSVYYPAAGSYRAALKPIHGRGTLLGGAIFSTSSTLLGLWLGFEAVSCS